MNRNVEIKVQLSDFNKTFNHLKDLCKNQKIREVSTIYQIDTFFNSDNGRLKIRQFNDNQGEVIWYNREDTIYAKLSEYIKIELGEKSLKNFKEVLSRSNGVTTEIINERILFMCGQTRIHFDNVEDLGYYLELEVVLSNEQSVEYGKSIANEILLLLELEKDPLIDCAYVDLLISKKQTLI